MTPTSNKKALLIRNLAIAFILLMPLAALGSRFGLWPFTLGLPLLLLSFAGSLIIQVIIFFWLLTKPTPATKSSLRGSSLIALAPILVIAVVMLSSEGDRNIMIHDISTDLDNPPMFIGAVERRGENSNPLESNAEKAKLQQQAHPDIAPIITTLKPTEAFQQALSTADILGWDIFDNNINQGHIEAVDTTFWFGFKDDIIIRVTPTAKGSRIDLRSVSRVGKGDMGTNAKRINHFREVFMETNP